MLRFPKMLLLTLCLFLAALSFMSCQKSKNWNCRCTYQKAGVEMERTFPLEDRTKKQAKENCNEALVAGTDVTDVSCDIEEQ